MIDRILKARLRALLQQCGLIPSRCAREMGRSHTWLSRKLDGERPLTVMDCDEVLAHLQLEPSALLDPVLLAGDSQLLLFTRTSPLRSEVAAIFAASSESIKRLAEQGLISIDTNPDGTPLGDPSICITNEGIKALRS